MKYAAFKYKGNYYIAFPTGKDSDIGKTEPHIIKYDTWECPLGKQKEIMIGYLVDQGYDKNELESYNTHTLVRMIASLKSKYRINIETLEITNID